MSSVLLGLQEAIAARYRVKSELGAGAASIVYLAHDLKHERDVALKMLRPELSALLGAQRFLNEIRFTCRLNHPNIMPLYDSGDAGGHLYYTMPVIEGESLRQKLEREKQLDIDEAIAITCAVATGLAYAHEHDIVHRDIKPENILLHRGTPLLADFGIAAAIHRVSAARLTATGISLGTPAYMSPEMATRDRVIGPASDIYALATVLFEMLAGDTPFTGNSMQAIISRIVIEKPLKLRVLRDTVPAHVEAAVDRALAKAPADRFASAAAFATAISAGTGRAAARHFAAPELAATGGRRRLPEWLPAALRVPAGGRRLLVALLILGVTAVTAFGLARRGLPAISTFAARAPAALDTTLYVVFPLEPRTADGLRHHSDYLDDALRYWDGITLVEAARVQDALRHAGTVSITLEVAAALAREFGAGRFVRGTVTSIGDSVRVYAVLYGTMAPDRAVREATAWLPARSSRPDSAYRRLAERLLFDNSGVGAPATRSVPARLAFVAGMQQLASWQLTAADSLFSRAVGHDADFEQAWLWLAQSRSWMRSPVAEWHHAADRAYRRAHTLGAADSLRAAALARMADGDTYGACGEYRRLTAAAPDDFAAWFGLGHCLDLEQAVVPDRRASTWRFRSSYNEALRAYRTAFLIRPSMHRAFRHNNFLGLQKILFTRPSLVRTGYALPPDTGEFRALPSWDGDSVVFIPFRDYETSAIQPGSIAIAIRQQRRVFHEIATAWRANDRTDPEALEALAVALDQLGDQSGLDTLRKARTLARSEEERARITTAEVWFRVKYSAPQDTAGLRAAVALADSLLASAAARAADPHALSGLAALTGRIHLAVSLARHPHLLSSQLPPAVGADAVALLLFSTAGAPADSIRHYERRIADLLSRGSLQPDRHRTLLYGWYLRAAGIALPTVSFPGVTQVSQPNPWLRAQIAFMRDDTAAVRAALDSLSELRTSFGLGAAELTIDALFPEAWLLARIGDFAAAGRRLGPTLDALAEVPLDVLTYQGRPATLVRAMALRAMAADRIGDRVTAARWQRAADVLWMHRDRALDTVLSDMVPATSPPR